MPVLPGPPDTRTVGPGPIPGVFRDGAARFRAPDGWALLPPGDAALTKRVKAAGPHWAVQEKRGRRTFSRGVLAPAGTIAAETARRSAERADPVYRRKLETGRAARARKEAAYAAGFAAAVEDYLGFAPAHAPLGRRVAAAVAAHATPVGSGTVARTQRIPIQERAAAAVIAWLRHRTTAYDHMRIPRVKGRRREVRRALAAESKRLLGRYRDGGVPPAPCPLEAALG
ncbi:DUF2293 domain-containing protein [Phycisphaera mikurensis]|uniref:DUF2293 domain-containing protein n=1 Tax=Phycisphaera mikurensis (strain NBRC 102666 / KCTC 22515 / FYK2301M01) TaxID=1142394 RepID=I0IBZ2_PHYMF|nr:DUF2293 domain-containing protein [Phycisphaera mikurensis]MBB6441996.1 hypothetical protein [Phycisphaera mikurensis]BAM02780.1 hypothetical protein PSMK_06210 [Phycisphaera mikurensis NBRC 102666]